jgi:hypothetical protein
MKKLREVTRPFSAMRYAKAPPDHHEFESGERLLFLRNHDEDGAHIIFCPVSDNNDTFIVAAQVFTASTSPVSTL